MKLSKVITSFPFGGKAWLGAFFLLISPFSLLHSQSIESWLQGYQKVLVIGAHPDDPESMCAGTALKLKNAGAEVVMVYFTSGEGGITGATEQEARDIRRAEALQACQVLGMRAVFMTQVDGRSEINQARYDEMKALIEAEQPDLVLTHWPIDSHRDHRNCAILVYDAWRRTGHSFDLYYGEVMTGLQTQTFSPTHWVDITETRDQKIKAYLCHVSQGTDDSVKKYHDTMEAMRGLECQGQWGEAFVKQLWKDPK